MNTPEYYYKIFQRQFIYGCYGMTCSNPFCRNSKTFQFADLKEEELDDKAYELATTENPNHMVCEHISPYLQYEYIPKKIEEFDIFYDELVHDRRVSNPKVFVDVLEDPKIFAFILLRETDFLTIGDFQLCDEKMLEFSNAFARNIDAYMYYQDKINSLLSYYINQLSVNGTSEEYFVIIRGLMLQLMFSPYFTLSQKRSITFLFVKFLLVTKPLAITLFMNLFNLPKFSTKFINDILYQLTLISMNGIDTKTDDSLPVITDFLAILYEFNRSRDQKIEEKLFVNYAFSEVINVDFEYNQFISNKFSYFKYPYLMTLEVKHKFKQLHTQYLTHSNQSTFDINVSREKLIEDSVAAFRGKEDHILVRRLNVQFSDEKGYDSGGITREFFYLVANEIFSEQFGMFKKINNDQFYWFIPGSLALSDKESFQMLGTFIGLAMFHNIILPIRFPDLLFKKLKGENIISIDCIKEIDPDYANNFQLMEDLINDVGDATDFDLFFVMSYESFGRPVEVELVENGSQKQVTNENFNEYKKLVFDWMLNKSIEKEFEAFKQGFMMLFEANLTNIFYPDELSILLSGVDSHDWAAFKSKVRYSEGYTPDSKSIQIFWKIFDSFTEDQRLDFLYFSTGSKKAPIGGLGKLDFNIQRASETKLLPVAHTCFNILQLPDYEDEEIMKKSLQICLNNISGFGIV